MPKVERAVNSGPAKPFARGHAGAARGAPSRAALLLRTRGRTIPWKHAAVYAAIVVALGMLVALWDHAYEARQAALLAPVPPQVLAKNLVEDVVGRGGVKGVSLDRRTGALALTVQDVLVKPSQSPAEQRKNLAAEGSLAIQLVQSRMPALKTITVHLVKGSTALATVSVKKGEATPTTVFAPALR